MMRTKASILTVVFLCLFILTNAQTWDNTIESIDTTIIGKTLNYRGSIIDLDDISFHQFSYDSLNWHKEKTDSDVWMRLSNTNQTSWVTIPIVPISNDTDSTNEIQLLTTDFSPGNIGITKGEVLNINVNDNDSDPINEIQTLSINGDTLSIAKAGYVLLPSFSIPNLQQVVSVGGTTSLPIEVNGFTSYNNSAIDGILEVTDSIIIGGTVTADSAKTIYQLARLDQVNRIVGDALDTITTGGPSYPLTSSNIPYWNGLTFDDSPFITDGTNVAIGDALSSSYRMRVRRETSGWAMEISNDYSTSGGSYGLYINTIGSSSDNIPLNVEGSFLVYGDGRLKAYGYGSSSIFTGTVYRYLAVDEDGNVIQATGTGTSGGDDWGNQVVIPDGTTIDGTGVTGDPLTLLVGGTPSNGYSITYNNGNLLWSDVSGGSGLLSSGTYGPYTTDHFGIGAAPLSYVPFRVSTSQSGYQAVLDNNNTNGGGIAIDGNDTDGDQYLFDARNSGTPRFQIRTDGALFVQNLSNGSTTYTLYYDTTTGEVFYGLAPGGGGGTGTVTSIGLASSDFSISGTNPITESGTFTIDLDNDAISNQPELSSGLLSTDELLISDGGIIKKMNISVIENYMQSNLDLGGSGAPLDANYLVGSSNSTLTNEIIVGTTPQGDLGNTWSSPTVEKIQNYAVTTTNPTDGKILVFRESSNAYVLEDKPISSGNPAWGDLTGTIDNQTDLITYLSNNYQPLGAYLTIETDPIFLAWDKDYNDLINTPTIPSGNQIIDWTLSGQGTIDPSNYVDNNTTNLGKSTASQFTYITSNTGANTQLYWTGTQTQYDALGSYDNQIIYFIENL